MFQRIVTKFTEHVLTEVTDRVRQVVREETADLRDLVNQFDSIQTDVHAIREGLEDVKGRLERINPTGEIPVTQARDQGI